LHPTPNLEHQASVFIPHDRMAQLYPEVLGSLFIAFYNSQGHLPPRRANNAGFNIKTTCISPQSVFMCFTWLSQYIAIISLKTVTQLVFIIGMYTCLVIQKLNSILMKFVLQRVKKLLNNFFYGVLMIVYYTPDY
jgi:hypothetical protein